MSRRDLIISALFLNIGVLALILLFASSGKKTTQALSPAHTFVAESVMAEAPENTAHEQAIEPVKKQQIPAAFDEIDQLLEEYMASDAKAELPANPQSTSSKKPVPVLLPLKTPTLVQTPSSGKKETKNVAKESGQVTSQGSSQTAPQSAPQSVPKEQFYTVRSGDNPWTIARKFHISFEKLLELNNLNESKARNLKIGQKLKIRE